MRPVDVWIYFIAQHQWTMVHSFSMHSFSWGARMLVRIIRIQRDRNKIFTRETILLICSVLMLEMSSFFCFNPIIRTAKGYGMSMKASTADESVRWAPITIRAIVKCGNRSIWSSIAHVWRPDCVRLNTTNTHHLSRGWTVSHAACVVGIHRIKSDGATE